ncbi:MAG: hypothetical protein INQ03_11355 [Candidatus Heimdallarchaeota archaeon]|nr:hypothetical protein [Candidatus Heimdallarchaeota archaeon]
MRTDHMIFKKFRSGIYFKDLLEEYEIDVDHLIHILQKNIKGNYDYSRVLTSHKAQKQFIAHLNTRPNPLDPSPIEKEIPPYIPTKERVE